MYVHSYQCGIFHVNIHYGEFRLICSKSVCLHSMIVAGRMVQYVN